MNKVKIDNTKYTNCLRLAFEPNEHLEDRIEMTKNFCLKYGFGDVMLLINSEGFCYGQMSIEEAKPWVEAAKKVKKVLNEAGISVSLNFWNTIGHVDRGRQLKPDQHFRKMMGIRGVEATWVCCPQDEKWLAYFKELVQYMVRELEPTVYWIEDDFRYHNHGDQLGYGEYLGGFGCFCDEHMRIYNEKLGTNYTREEFAKQIFQAKPNHARNMWMDNMRLSMNKLSYEIGNAIKSVNVGTEIGLMSSGYPEHAIEERDWKQIGENFKNTRIIHRLHLPVFCERTGKDYYYDFNSEIMSIRTLIQEDVDVYPELENSAMSTYSKNARFLKFQTESALPLIVKGMTCNIASQIGNAPTEEWGYGDVIRELNPYMQAIMDLKIKFSSLQGVIIPLSEYAARYVSNVKDFKSMAPHANEGGAYLAGLGITYKFSTEKSFKNECVYFCAENVQYFTRDELEKIFQDNYVILDGYAVFELYERGFGDLLSIKSLTSLDAESGIVPIEKIVNDYAVEGQRGYTIPVEHRAMDDVMLLQYDCPVNVFSKLCDYTGKPVENGMIWTDKFAVLPGGAKGKIQHELFNPARKLFIENQLKAHLKNGVVYNQLGVSPYLYKRDNDSVLMLVNTTVETFKNVSFVWLGEEIKEIKEVNRNGEIKEVAFTLEGNTVTINEEFDYLSTKAFVIA